MITVIAQLALFYTFTSPYLVPFTTHISVMCSMCTNPKDPNMPVDAEVLPHLEQA